MPKTPGSKPAKPTAQRNRRIAANRRLSKELVMGKMKVLRATGAVITAATLYNAVGRIGSMSTLIKLRKEIEAENPGEVQNRELVLVLNYIANCDRTNLAVVSEAVGRRRRVVHLNGKLLRLDVCKDDQATMKIIRDFGAYHIDFEGWSVDATLRNFDRLLGLGFVSGIESAIRQALSRAEPHR